MTRDIPRLAAWLRRFIPMLATLALTVAPLTALPRAARAADPSAYRGLTLHFLTAHAIHQDALNKKMQEIAKSWGMKLETRFVTADQLDQKVVIDYVGGADTWDIVYTQGLQRMFELAQSGVVRDLKPLMSSADAPAQLDWNDFMPDAQRAVTHDGHIYGLTIATSDPALAYRKDLFADPGEQQAFQARYGYKLQPPDTYAQFRDVAEFFTRKKGEMLAGHKLDRDFYGTIFGDKRGTYLFHKYEGVMAAFGVSVYDPTTHRSGLAGPADLKAAEYYKSLGPFQPASHINMASGETIALFADGEVAMTIEYFDRVLASLSRMTAVTADMVGYVVPPTAEGNPMGRVHALRSGPVIVSIYGRSAHPEAAYALLEAATSSGAQTDMALKTPGYVPSRVSSLRILAQHDPAVSYLSSLGASKADVLTDLDIIGYPAILKSSNIEDAVSNAMAQVLIGTPAAPELQKAADQVEKAMAEVKP